MKSKPSFFGACLLLSSGMAVAACSQGATDSTMGQSSDSLLSAMSAASGDAGNACTSCIQTSCGAELMALQTELQGLRSEATSAFQCVRANRCFSSIADPDAGGRAAAGACIAACAADAGLPSFDAAAGAVKGLGSALDQCIDTSCATACPGAAEDRDDRDGGEQRAVPAFDGSFPHVDGSCAFGNLPHFDGGFGAGFPFDAGPQPFGGGFPAFGEGRR